MKNKAQSRYDSYFESIASFLDKSQQPVTNLVEIEITKLDSYVKFKFNFHLDKIDLENINKPFLIMWSDWDPKQPFTPSNKKSPIDVEDLVCNNNVKIKVTYEKESTYFYITDLDQNITKFQITFFSVNTIIPVSENTPYNRYVLHLNFWVSKNINNPFLMRIIRDSNVVTKFTKGNYSLAFPSRSLYDKRVTNIYFDKQDSYFLKLGISIGNIDSLTQGWRTFLKLGLTLIFVSFLLSFKKFPMFEIIGSVVALLLPLMQNLPTYFHTTRLKYYTAKEDLNSLFTLISIMYVGLNLFLVYLFYLGYYSNILKVTILIQGIIFLLVAIIGLILLRKGYLEKYICDMPKCTSRLYNRYSAWNCYLTGRVVCKKCIKEICQHCPIYNSTIWKTGALPCLKLSNLSKKKQEGGINE